MNNETDSGARSHANKQKCKNKSLKIKQRSFKQYSNEALKNVLKSVQNTNTYFKNLKFVTASYLKNVNSISY